MNIQLSLHTCKLQIINKIKTKSMLITGTLKSMSAHCDSVHSQNMRDALSFWQNAKMQGHKYHATLCSALIKKSLEQERARKVIQNDALTRITTLSGHISDTSGCSKRSDLFSPEAEGDGLSPEQLV